MESWRFLTARRTRCCGWLGTTADPEMAIEHAYQVPDECSDLPAYLLRSSWL